MFSFFAFLSEGLSIRTGGQFPNYLYVCVSVCHFQYGTASFKGYEKSFSSTVMMLPVISGFVFINYFMVRIFDSSSSLDLDEDA